MKIQLALIFLLISIIGKSQAEKIKIIAVEPYMAVTNEAFGKELKLNASDRDAEFIKGFNFEWGYSYKLKVKVHKLKNPPEDGSDTDYILVKTIAKTKVPLIMSLECCST
jgi:hypothetical protein